MHSFGRMVFFQVLGVFALIFTPIMGSPTLLARDESPNAGSKGKVIIDNDFLSGQWDPYLLALNAGWEILGLTTCM